MRRSIELGSSARRNAVRVVVLMTALLSASGSMGQDARSEWPTYRGDLRRSGTSTIRLDPHRLVPDWTWQSPAPIRSAWPAPAKWDAYAALSGMKSMRNYDPVLHVTSATDGVGRAIFLPGITDDTVRRLDAETGREIWRFTADAPVRIAPTWHEGRLHFGSDDGCAYALDGESGRLLWRTSVVPDARWIFNNGRLISPWPVRTGVHVHDGTAYCAASFLPWESTHVCALDAATGEVSGPGRYIRDLGSGWTMEGPMLLSEDALIVPQGRVAPLLLSRSNGEPLGPLEGGGGSFVLLTEEDAVLHGPGNKAGWITDSSTGTRERVATYQKGNAMIIDGGVAWLLADTRLTALDRATRTLLYSVKTRTPHALIKSGDTLFAGGKDIVAAYDAETGSLVWEAPVEGNAHGLAASHDRLIVSTDRGAVHAFRMGRGRSPLAVEPIEPDETEQAALPAMTPISDPALVDRWVFREDLVAQVPIVEGEPRTYPVIRNEVEGRPNGRFRELNEFTPTPIGGYLTFNGASNDLELTAPGTEPDLPVEACTLVAVARIDETQQWGGLIGALQDNGENESGIILGYRGMRPGIGLRADDGTSDTRYHWTLSETSLEPGTWHVIAGTFDGTTTRLYVDGKEVAANQVEQGAIVYPERFWYTLGAYHDDDEYFVTRGAMAEARVYARALEPDEIRAIEEPWTRLLEMPAIKPPPVEERPTAEPEAGPIFAFTAPGTATVTWRTSSPVETWLALDGCLHGRHFTTNSPTEEHLLTLTDLEPDRIYTVQLGLVEDGSPVPSREYMLDTSFNYALPEMTSNVEHTRAREALERTGMTQGIALVIGAGDPDLARSLAQESSMRVIVIDENRERIERFRTRLLDADDYGDRITARHVESYEDAPLPPRSINLVLVDTEDSIDQDELIDHLVPGTGACLHDGRMIVAPEEPGTGTWTHMYGNPDNTGYGGESLGGVHEKSRLGLQWIGRPGPRYQSDRGNRKPAPLSASGRLHMQGLERIITLDANNGTILWSLELPEVKRFNMPRDTGNWCLDEDTLYVAGERLLVIDSATGTILRTQSVPAPEEGVEYDWGYVARSGKHLLGSAQKRGNAHTGWWGSEHWYDGKDNFSVLKVCSDSLFATDPRTGSIHWRYEPDALIINPSITTADGSIVFLEAGDDSLFEQPSRQLEDVRLWQQLELVALDQATGEELWRREARPMPGRIAVYTAAAEGILYMQTSDAGAFALYAFDLGTGESLWRRRFDWETDHHGKHLSRLAIAGDLLYLRPYVLDARSGEVLRTEFPKGHQCGNYACTTDSIILRAGELAMWSPRQDVVSRWTRVRPDCWISTIPACGMLLSPEGGGGCSCGSWIEASMGFRPVLEGSPGNVLRTGRTE